MIWLKRSIRIARCRWFTNSIGVKILLELSYVWGIIFVSCFTVKTSVTWFITEITEFSCVIIH